MGGLVDITGISHSYGDKQLYKNATFSLYKGEHMGVVGVNGAGKSTLIKTLIGEVVPDEGLVRWQKNVRWGCLDQYAVIDDTLTIFQYLRTAFSYLYKMEAELKDLLKIIGNNPEMALLKKVSYYQDTLERDDIYSIDSRIQRVAAGLGLTSIGLDRPIAHLSGGQRGKTILAKLLLENNDVLLLDEPTNFLDKEHIEWLTRYLKNFKGAFIVVSHDVDFLNNICNCICEIEFGTIKKYNGDYWSFLEQKEQRELEYTRRFENQQREIAKAEKFITKNKARAATAAMARGRQKKLDKMERIAAPASGKLKPKIHFAYTPATTQKVLVTDNLEVGYYYPLLPKINLVVKNGEKSVICGFNGIGKSTLLKTLVSVIPPLKGNFTYGEKVIPGYYEQDLIFDDDSKTPFEYILDKFPSMSVKDVRTALAKVAIQADHVDQPLKTLSGGEQAKVKMCCLTLEPSNLLFLDEPTNHLDGAAQESLKKAILEFKGTVLLVSHDESFYSDWADRIINIEELLYEANNNNK